MIEPAELADILFAPAKEARIEDAAGEWLALQDLRSTGRVYKTDIELFLSFLEGNGLGDALVHEVDAGHIAAFQKRERDRGISINTTRRRIYALRSFFEWTIYEKGYTSRNPARSVKMPKKIKNYPEVLTYEEVQSIINQPDLRTKRGKRDMAMLSLTYETGVRISELCGLKTTSIREHMFPHKKNTRPAIVVDGKAGKTRAIPLSKKALSDLNVWLSVRPHVEHDYLFINLKNGEPVTTFGFRALFMKYARMAGLDVDNRKISPHTLRHSFATHLARDKWPIKHVQDLLGHSCIQNTEIYLHLANEDLVEAVDSLSSSKPARGPGPRG